MTLGIFQEFNWFIFSDLAICFLYLQRNNFEKWIKSTNIVTDYTVISFSF